MSTSRRTAARVLITVATLTCGLPPGPATASPPTPLVTKMSDLARATAVEGGRFLTPPGTDTVTAVYSFAPGSASAWTDRRAASVLAVTKGTLTLRIAEGCTEKQYRAGGAAVVPGGSIQVVNEGSDTLEFVGVFANLPRAAADPFTGSGAAAACGTAGPVAPAVADHARGTFVPVAAYGESLHARHAGGITIEPDTDVLVSSYTYQPGFSSGWFTHKPAINIIAKGTFAYYEARDGGGCVKSEEYGPGQAYTHVGGVHMAVNESDAPVEAVTVAFNLPHDSVWKKIPGVGNTLDAIDVTPLPPAECPRVN